MDYAVWLREWGFPLSALVFVLWSGSRGLWVFGREVTDLRERLHRTHQQADAWRNIALGSTELAKTAAQFFEKNGSNR